MNQEGMLKPALIGGVLLGILSALPVLSLFNCFCCAWEIGGGMLAAHLYVKASPTVVTLGSGVGLGLFTGAIGAVVQTIFSIPLHLALRGMSGGFAEQFKGMLEQIPNLPPESKEAIRSLLSGGSFSIVFLLLSGIFTLVLFSIMGMAGGAIGVAVFERRKTGEPPAYQPPTPPPIDIPPPPPPYTGA
jgi:hypothetical protein